MVRESNVTYRSFPSAVKEPVGVGNFGLPIDAGISRATSPSMLTVKVCASMSATLTTEAPVSKLLFSPLTETVIGVCAGKYSAGVNSTTWSSSHVNDPGVAGAPTGRTVIDDSAAERSATGSVNVTVTGCATPTVCPGWGDTPATGPGWVEPADAVTTGSAVDRVLIKVSAPTTAAR